MKMYKVALMPNGKVKILPLGIDYNCEYYHVYFDGQKSECAEYIKEQEKNGWE